MLARDPLGIVQVWSERLEEGKQAVLGAEAGALGALVLELRLKVHGVEDYAPLMASLRLPDPKMMDVAVPANMRQGLHQEEVARRGWAYSTDEAKGLVGRWVALIDLREKAGPAPSRVRCTPPTPICRTISTTAASSMSSQ
jgi:hypothetical protein